MISSRGDASVLCKKEREEERERGRVGEVPMRGCKSIVGTI